MTDDLVRKAKIPLSKVHTEGTQCRAETYDISEMAAEIREEKCVRQPIVVFHDGKLYWVADGHHRTKAAREAGLEKISALVHEGGQRDALLYATGANAEHGHRRTNADKRNAVLTLLRDKSWAKWSDREIAKRCAVSNRFVTNVRDELSVNRSQISTTRTVQRGNTVYKQDTANIGKSREAVQSKASEPQEPKSTTLTDVTAPPALGPKQLTIPGAEPHSPSLPSPEPDEDYSFLAPTDSNAKPINGPEMVFENPHFEPEISHDNTTTMYGAFDESVAVVETIRYVQSFMDGLQQKFDAVDPRHLVSFRKRAESILIRLAEKAVSLMPPDGMEAERARAKFGVIQGGQK